MQQVEEGANTQIPTQAVADIVSAYVAHNHISVDQIPGLIQSVASAMTSLTIGGASAPATAEKAEPAVSVRKSITPDYIIDLFTGKRFKSLKRHLRTRHNMSPEDYRAYWGLPSDYPMVAPNYAKSRSDLAKKMGLGQGGRQPPKAAEAPKAPKAAAKPKSAPKAKATGAAAKPAEAPKADTPAVAEA